MIHEFDKLVDLTREWHKKLGIIPNASFENQLLKLISEVGELADNIGKCNYQACKDDIGDCLVVLNGLCCLLNKPYIHCMKQALPDYNIKSLQDFKSVLKKRVITNRLTVVLPEYVFYMCISLGKLSQVDDVSYTNLDKSYYLGDIYRYLYQICYQLEFTFEQCWTIAYEEIKDRKGYLTKDGNFIKDSDPYYNQIKEMDK